MSRSVQAAFYDQRWASQPYVGPNKLKRASAILSEMAQLRLFPGQERPRIVDVGCGSGWMTGILSQWGPTVGVDLPGATIAAAPERYPTARFEAADLREWRPSESYDLAVCQEVIEHFLGVEQERFVDTLADALKPGGWLILTTDNRDTFESMPPEEREPWLDQPVEATLSDAELLAALSRRFEVVRLTTIIPGYGRHGWRAITALSHRRLRVLDPLWLRLGAGLHLLAVARKRT